MTTNRFVLFNTTQNREACLGWPPSPFCHRSVTFQERVSLQTCLEKFLQRCTSYFKRPFKNATARSLLIVNKQFEEIFSLGRLHFGGRRGMVVTLDRFHCVLAVIKCAIYKCINLWCICFECMKRDIVSQNCCHICFNSNLPRKGLYYNVFFSRCVYQNLSCNCSAMWLRPKKQKKRRKIPVFFANILLETIGLVPRKSVFFKYLHSFICLFCRSLFVLLYFFFWSLCCLFFFDIRILITPLVSSNSSYTGQEPFYLSSVWPQIPIKTLE